MSLKRIVLIFLLCSAVCVILSLIFSFLLKPYAEFDFYLKASIFGLLSGNFIALIIIYSSNVLRHRKYLYGKVNFDSLPETAVNYIKAVGKAMSTDELQSSCRLS